MKNVSGFLTPADLANIIGNITVHGVYKILKNNGIEVISTSSKRKRITPLGIRKLLTSKGFKYPKENISFQIVKGGVGKTTLSYALGLRASHYGAKVLLIDLDQQGNLTRSFKIESRDFPVWLNIFRDNVPAKDAVINLTETLDIIPSNLNNSRLDLELTQSASNLKDTIKDAIKPIRNKYDLIIFDCPPAINKISLCATCASDKVIIPVTPDPYAMDGLEFTLSELGQIKHEFKLNFENKIVWNRYDARERLAAIFMHKIAKDKDKIENVLPVVIRVDTSFKNSIFNASSLFDLPRKCNVIEDINQFTEEILGIISWSISQNKEKDTIKMGL